MYVRDWQNCNPGQHKFLLPVKWEIYGATHSMSCRIVWVKHNGPVEQYLISSFTFQQRESRNHEGIQKREYFLY